MERVQHPQIGIAAGGRIFQGCYVFSQIVQRSRYAFGMSLTTDCQGLFQRGTGYEAMCQFLRDGRGLHPVANRWLTSQKQQSAAERHRS